MTTSPPAFRLRSVGEPPHSVKFLLCAYQPAIAGYAKVSTGAGPSKDNYFFGVRAVDKHGNRSPVTFPAPFFG